METIISSSPVVSAVLVTGAGRFQSSLLVEAIKPHTNELEKQELLDTIWKSVRIANKESPSHGRIHRDMIAFTTAKKPMLRAGKGTVQRKMTLELYKTELDALYESNAELTNDPTNNTSNSHHHSVPDTIKHIVTAATGLGINSLIPEADLFEMGIDSLQVTLIARQINQFLSVRGRPQSLDARSALFDNLLTFRHTPDLVQSSSLYLVSALLTKRYSPRAGLRKLGCSSRYGLRAVKVRLRASARHSGKGSGHPVHHLPRGPNRWPNHGSWHVAKARVASQPHCELKVLG